MAPTRPFPRRGIDVRGPVMARRSAADAVGRWRAGARKTTLSWQGTAGHRPRGAGSGPAVRPDPFPPARRHPGRCDPRLRPRSRHRNPQYPAGDLARRARLPGGDHRIADVLKSERMGHEVPGMRGVYSHVSTAMRAELTAALQERWTASLRQRSRLAPRSIVPVLDVLLTQQQPASDKIGSQLAPKIGHQSGELRPRSRR